MSGLFSTLNIGAESLYANRQGVDTTGHNIANAQTPGYSRQRLSLKARMPSLSRGIIIGNGVYAEGIQRAHDQFVEKQLVLSNHDTGHNSRFQNGLQSIESIYSPEMAAGLADEISSFFASLQDLANFPENSTARTAVRDMAKNLTSSFQRIDSSLRQNLTDSNDLISRDITDLNQLLTSVARLNVQINEMNGGPSVQANDLIDERDRLVRTLAGKIDVHYYEDQHGMISVRGPNEVLLVDGARSGVFKSSRSEDGLGNIRILVDDQEGGWARDITDSIKGGELKGSLKIRDEVIPDLIEKNNQMALALSREFNSAHRDGFGLGSYKSSNGRNFFTEIQDEKFAAQQFGIEQSILDSVDAISVASTPLAPGDNVIANRLLTIKDKGLLGREQANLIDFYANYVGDFGLQVARAQHVSEADGLIKADLESRRDAVSGVSLDEEAASLLKWQTCFTASSKLITTIDEMLDSVLSLKR